MPAPITPNETAAAVSCDGLDFVFSTTLPLTPWKDRDHGFVHPQGACVHR